MTWLHGLGRRRSGRTWPGWAPAPCWSARRTGDRLRSCVLGASLERLQARSSTGAADPAFADRRDSKDVDWVRARRWSWWSGSRQHRANAFDPRIHIRQEGGIWFGVSFRTPSIHSLRPRSRG